MLGFALGAVSPKLPRAGWALAGAAGLDLVTMCRSRALWRTMRTLDTYAAQQTLMLGTDTVELLSTLLVGATTIAALALLASDAKRNAAPR